MHHGIFYQVKVEDLSPDLSFPMMYYICGNLERNIIKIELKAVDLNAIQAGKNATQHLTANEIVTSTHLIITVFDGIQMKSNYIMSICQFVENSGVKKYNDYDNYDLFISDYTKLSNEQSNRRKNCNKDKLGLINRLYLYFQKFK